MQSKIHTSDYKIQGELTLTLSVAEANELYRVIGKISNHALRTLVPDVQNAFEDILGKSDILEAIYESISKELKGNAQ